MVARYHCPCPIFRPRSAKQSGLLESRCRPPRHCPFPGWDHLPPPKMQQCSGNGLDADKRLCLFGTLIGKEQLHQRVILLTFVERGTDHKTQNDTSCGRKVKPFAVSEDNLTKLRVSVPTYRLAGQCLSMALEKILSFRVVESNGHVPAVLSHWRGSSVRGAFTRQLHRCRVSQKLCLH